MAVTLRHSFESGQTTGTTVTTGNSATGGNAFDSVTIGTGATVTYDSTAYRGSLSCLSTTTGSVSSASVNWTTAIGTALPHVYGRAVINAASLSVLIPWGRHRGAAAQTCRLTLNTAGHIELRNGANTVLQTSTATLSTATWYLIRWDITVGASATGIVYIHTDPTSAAAAETLTANSANFGTNNVDEANYGIVVATASITGIRVDDVVVTDQGLPGPPTQSIAIAETLTAADAIARTKLASRAAAETLTAADTIARAMASTRAAAESLTAADSIARAMSASRAAAEGLTAGDAVARALAASRPAAESLSASDAIARACAQARTGGEGLGASDGVGRGLLLPRTVAETLTLADMVTASAALPALTGVLAPTVATAGVTPAVSAGSSRTTITIGRLGRSER